MLVDQAGAEAADAYAGDVGPTLGALLLTAVAIFGSVMLFAALALVGTELLGRDVTEEAVIGLTPESEWPFHDVHLAAAAAQLDDPAFVSDLQSDLGLPADPQAVAVDQERGTGDGVLVVRADAATGDQAAALANAVVDEIVADPELPLFVVDRADGRSEPVGRASTVGAGALVGLLLGLVALPRRRVTRA